MKLITMENRTVPVEYESRQLVSDLFHQLSQPITTLCCSLELALLQTPNPEEYGEIMSQALCQAEKVSALATAIRELFDAGQAGENGEVLQLRTAVTDTVSDLLPVAKSAGVQVCFVPGPPCPVWFDAPRLRQGLFHLAGFVIGSATPGDSVRIELAARGTEAMLGLTVLRERVCDRPPDSISDQELLRRLGLGIARAIFAAAGGSLTVKRAADGFSVEVRLSRTERRSGEGPAQALGYVARPVELL
jgi:C4-dicarboxylate-specific signal transduction histidine kinase